MNFHSPSSYFGGGKNVLGRSSQNQDENIDVKISA